MSDRRGWRYCVSEVKLYLGDCLEVMKSIPDKSVDAVITDLPYGTTACAWDEVIPFGLMWERTKWVLKPRGAFVTTASQPFTSKLVTSNVGWFRDEWIWEKDRATRHLDANRRPMKAHENILVFGYKLPKYTPQITDGHKPANKPQMDNIGNLDKLLRGGLHASNKYGHTTRYPRSVLKIYCTNGDERGYHPTQKPVALYEYLIRTYTNEGDTVLDITMGSGTTGVACVQTGRNFIGIEIDEKYFKIAEKRIKDAQQQMRLPI